MYFNYRYKNPFFDIGRFITFIKKYYTQPLQNWDAHSRSKSHITSIKTEVHDMITIKEGFLKKKPKAAEDQSANHAAIHVGKNIDIR
jgi:hypothetical protein